MTEVDQEPCRLRTLCRNDVAHVQRCIGCGCISVHMGAFTVRLDNTGLEALWAVLGDAAAVLHAQKQAELAMQPRGHA